MGRSSSLLKSSFELFSFFSFSDFSSITGAVDVSDGVPRSRGTDLCSGLMVVVPRIVDSISAPVEPASSAALVGKSTGLGAFFCSNIG